MGVLLIANAFLFGLVAQQFRLSPLVGFLVAGFVQPSFRKEGGEALRSVSALGVTLQLFSVGQDPNPRAVPVEQFDPVAVAIGEDEHRPLPGVFAQMMLGHGPQAVELLAHVHRGQRHEDFATQRKSQHGRQGARPRSRMSRAAGSSPRRVMPSGRTTSKRDDAGRLGGQVSWVKRGAPRFPHQARSRRRVNRRPGDDFVPAMRSRCGS